MDWLKRLLGGRQDAAPEQKAVSGETPDWQAVVQEAETLAARLERPAIALTIETEAPPDAPVSSIGGKPSLPPDMEWPHHGGGPMLFLAQIAYSEMPRIDEFPQSGLLSVFVADDDLNGCGFPSRGQDGFRTIFFEETEGLVRRPAPGVPEFDPLGATLRADGARLTGTAVRMPPLPECQQIAELTSDWPREMPNDIFDEFTEGLSARKASVIYFGGHPDFVQYDIRSAEDAKRFDRVLLQIGYLTEGREASRGICWGDAGEATFLIGADDLSSRTFDRAIYNWDCG